jgi:imidazolonepropionase-like amidohydrolase
MKDVVKTLATCLLWTAAWAHASLVSAQVGGPTSRGALEPGVRAIVNVNVIPMTGAGDIRNASILIRDGRIAAVGPASEVSIPEGTERVDGGGGWVIPGLTDMHTHLYSDLDLPDIYGPAELGVMLANGVTTIRLMAGTPEQLALRAAVERGDVLGPQMWLTGPYFGTEEGDNTRVITSPEDARAAVREVVAAGYDFVKLTFGITGDVYAAVVDEARRAGIRVVGHVEPAVGVRAALAAGQQMEHLDAFLEGALADDAPMTMSLTQFDVYRPENWASLDWIDVDELDALAEETARSGLWVGPTLHLFNRAFSDPYGDEELRALPDWAYIPDAIKAPYMRSRERYWAQPVPLERRRQMSELRNRIVKHIADAGGHIFTGSDSPDLLMAYGFTLHRELESLVQAGLTPRQALTASTRSPAEFLHALDDFGTVQPGRRGDLVLVAADPLQDIGNTKRIQKVIVGGLVLDRAALDRMLEEGRTAIAAYPPDD